MIHRTKVPIICICNDRCGSNLFPRGSLAFYSIIYIYLFIYSIIFFDFMVYSFVPVIKKIHA